MRLERERQGLGKRHQRGERRIIVEDDAGAEILLDPYYRLGEIGEGVAGIGAGIGEDDELGAAADHLVDPEIVEMPAIAEAQRPAFLVAPPVDEIQQPRLEMIRTY